MGTWKLCIVYIVNKFKPQSTLLKFVQFNSSTGHIRHFDAAQGNAVSSWTAEESQHEYIKKS